MLKTDVKKEVRKLVIDEGITLSALAEKCGTSRQYVSRMLNNSGIVVPMFVKLLEAGGYDIEIKFVKREEEK